MIEVILTQRNILGDATSEQLVLLHHSRDKSSVVGRVNFGYVDTPNRDCPRRWP